MAAQPRGVKQKRSGTPVRKSARLQERKYHCQPPDTQEKLFQLPCPTSLQSDKEVCSTTPRRITTATDLGQSVHRNQSILSMRVESGNGVKSLDLTTHMRPKELPVHFPNTGIVRWSSISEKSVEKGPCVFDGA